jgi:hypothetical protein
MSLDLLAVQDQITAKLRELAQDVYETTAPDDSKLRFDANGMILPYIVVRYSDMYDSIDSRGVVSSRYDTKVSYADVMCIGPTDRSVRQVAGLVRDKLLGFTPSDAGELRIDGGTHYVGIDPKPNRFEAELSFVFPVNTVW